MVMRKFASVIPCAECGHLPKRHSLSLVGKMVFSLSGRETGALGKCEFESKDSYCDCRKYVPKEEDEE